jgi:ribosomal protein S6
MTFKAKDGRKVYRVRCGNCPDMQLAEAARKAKIDPKILRFLVIDRGVNPQIAFDSLCKQKQKTKSEPLVKIPLRPYRPFGVG